MRTNDQSSLDDHWNATELTNILSRFQDFTRVLDSRDIDPLPRFSVKCYEWHAPSLPFDVCSHAPYCSPPLKRPHSFTCLIIQYHRLALPFDSPVFYRMHLL